MLKQLRASSAKTPIMLTASCIKWKITSSPSDFRLSNKLTGWRGTAQMSRILNAAVNAYVIAAVIAAARNTCSRKPQYGEMTSRF
jgi:hypothetical protein